METEKRQVSAMLRSFVTQLLAQQNEDGLPDILVKCYNESQDGKRGPSEEVLLEVLKNLIGAYKQVFLVVDALDESLETEHLLQTFALIKSWEFPGLRILSTSRQFFEDSQIMESMTTSTISLGGSPVDHDILLYITRRFETDEKLKVLPSDIKTHIENTLMAKSSGM